jgi:hypothetical protein
VYVSGEQPAAPEGNNCYIAQREGGKWMERNTSDLYTCTRSLVLDKSGRLFVAAGRIACGHVFRHNLPVREQLPGWGGIIRQLAGTLIRIDHPRGNAAEVHLARPFIASQDLPVQVELHSLLHWIDIWAKRGNVRVLQHAQARAIRPVELAVPTVAIASPICAFIPAIFGKPIISTNPVKPHHLPIVQAQRI